MRIPGLHGRIVRFEGAAQFVERTGIVEWVNVASDDLRHRPHPRPRHRILGQEWRLRIQFVDILDDGKRLQQDLAIVERERRHPPLRIDGAVAWRMLFATVPGQVDRNGFEGQPLQVEGDARAIGGG